MASQVAPDNYGLWWRGGHCDEQWYRDIFNLRRDAHENFISWLGATARRVPIATTLEVGCGQAQVYGAALAGYGYHGCDIAPPQIDACQRRFPDRRYNFFVADALHDNLHGPYDLVFSHAVIDHVADIDLFLTRLVAASRRLLFVSCYNGWHKDLEAHRYRWVEGRTCFKNEVSPSRARDTLEAAGCRDIGVYPVDVGNALETVIVAVTPAHV